MTPMEAFMAELTELSKKHRLIIIGCGCCGSPDIIEPDKWYRCTDDHRYVMTDRLRFLDAEGNE